MCGIAGFCSMTPQPRHDALAAMVRALRHRGPDDQGLALWGANGAPAAEGEPAIAGLGHARLSIIDLSPAGHQPMTCGDGSTWIAFNGEIYNFAELRRELEARGRVFRSRTDTEAILHLYEEFGPEGLLRRLNGMFAIAIWDRRRRTLILARDRVGKKPLYLASGADGALHFASEIKALVAAGCVDTAKRDEAALLQFWTYGYVTGEQTHYTDVRQLPPGYWAEWREGRLAVRPYWDCAFGQVPPRARPLDDLADELEALLCDAIRMRLIADVPLGLFLSGGIDSSLVAALARKVAGPGLRTYTIAFDQRSHDESPFAAAVARHLDLENRLLTVGADMNRDFEAIARQFDEPFGDSSCIPTYHVSALARREVTVALTGDGGDELFAGYQNHREALRLWGSAEQRRICARPVSARQRLRDIRARLRPESERLMDWERLTTPRWTRRLFSADFLARAKRMDALEPRQRQIRRTPDDDLLSQAQQLNFKTYLPDDVLVKVDRMSMAHALETRSPLLDYRITEFAARLPFDARMDAQGRGKVLLRHLLARHIPRELFERPKQGFAVPWHALCPPSFRAGLAQRWRALGDPVFRPDAADWLFSDAAGDRLQWNALATLACPSSGRARA